MTAIPRAIRELVLARDMFCCISCGRHLGGATDYSVHHRIPRGMGGSTDARLNLPSNLVAVCGSGTTGCHGWIESYRDQARAWGYLVPRLLDPAQVAVYTGTGWTYFNDGGGVSYPPPPNVSPDRIAELRRDVERARDQRMRWAAA